MGFFPLVGGYCCHLGHFGHLRRLREKTASAGNFFRCTGSTVRHTAVMAGRHTGGVRTVLPLAGSFVSLWLFQGYFMAAPWGGFFLLRW
jgi:hypothetical protein